MILYTMMPQELIFPTQEQDFAEPRLVSYQGVPLMVERTEDHSYRVIRVMSTDPKHFLNESYSPGSKISF